MKTQASPSPRPQSLGKTAWYYESPGSIIVVVEARDAKGNYLTTTQTRIRWDQLLKSAKRCGRSLP